MPENKKATIYIKTEQNKELHKDEVFLKDLGKVLCSDPQILAKVKSLPLHTFRKGEPKRQVISIMKMIAEIEKLYPNANVVSLGAADTLVERIPAGCRKKQLQSLKLLFVSAISFFGTAFTIMAFHNDIGINDVFLRIHEMVTGTPGDGYSILELAYSIGLAVGIILFFNHIGGRRITKDPTPIEVEMRIYEEDVNKALIETADREGKTIDVP